MPAKVIYLQNLTRHDQAPDRVLQGALDADLDGIVIMGYDKDGGHYFASSYADGGTILWLIEKLKKRLMEMGG